MRATLDAIVILDGANRIAEHKRSYEKGKQIEDESHIKELIARKQAARKHRGQDRLMQAVPISQTLFIQAAERGYSLGTVTANLLKLLDQYGASELEAAINEALSRGVPHPNAVRLSLEKWREERGQTPAAAIELPNDERVRDLVVRPHDLKSYDQLQLITEEKNDAN